MLNHPRRWIGLVSAAGVAGLAGVGAAPANHPAPLTDQSTATTMVHDPDGPNDRERHGSPVAAPSLVRTAVAPPAPAPAPPPARAATRVITNPHPAPPPTRPPAPPPGPSATERQAAQAVVAAINHDRVAAGLAPLGWSGGLSRSAHLHNLAMAGADALSHQLPGEPPLGTRISRQGIGWSWVGENIGDYSDLSIAGALALHRMMMAEKPPYDEHRLIILSPVATMVGVDVVFDTAHHRLWLTEDFAN